MSAQSIIKGLKCVRCKAKTCFRRKDGRNQCKTCKALFDDDPNEGGTHGNKPHQRLEREERAAGKRRARSYDRRAERKVV